MMEQMEKEFQGRRIEWCKIGYINLKEAGFWSPKRKFLRLTYKELIYDICVAHHGNSTFVSSWLGERPLGFIANVLLLIPVIDSFVIRRLERKTYYQYDSLMIFQEAVHNTVLHVHDGYSSNKGVKPTQGPQRRPIMKNLMPDFPSESEIWPDLWEPQRKE